MLPAQMHIPNSCVLPARVVLAGCDPVFLFSASAHRKLKETGLRSVWDQKPEGSDDLSQHVGLKL